LRLSAIIGEIDGGKDEEAQYISLSICLSVYLSVTYST